MVCVALFGIFYRLLVWVCLACLLGLFDSCYLLIYDYRWVLWICCFAVCWLGFRSVGGDFPCGYSFWLVCYNSVVMIVVYVIDLPHFFDCLGCFDLVYSCYLGLRFSGVLFVCLLANLRVYNLIGLCAMVVFVDLRFVVLPCGRVCFVWCIAWGGFVV